MDSLSSGETKPPTGGPARGKSKPLDPNAKEWSPKTDGAPEGDRCLFITFSSAHPIPKHRLLRFFKLKYGDSLESVYVHLPAPKDVKERKIRAPKPKFGKVVFTTSVVPMQLTMGGKRQVKFTVDGKPVWCKKYDTSKSQASKRNSTPS
ncbi:hypothetical protein V6N13_045989 [Hibiscus sabdariffa]|uniref:Uncharacterized protein n=2 Tax=Hibiscus sabdariffa TaxID=183260 RepID=A0ABR2AR60_9ROSI